MSTTLLEDEALLVAALAALGHRTWGHGSTRPWMRARLRARVRELGLADTAYIERLGHDERERRAAARAVACSMSRFHRGGRVLEALRLSVLPELAAAPGIARIWSAGAARGEEALTLAMLWLELPPPPGKDIAILATDIREDSLAEGRVGQFAAAAVREVPAPTLARWFEPVPPPLGEPGAVRVREQPLRLVRFELHDLERDPWPGEQDVILLRSVCFTYWGEPLQRQAVERAHAALRPGGYLAIGRHERLPDGCEADFAPLTAGVNLFRRRP